MGLLFTRNSSASRPRDRCCSLLPTTVQWTSAGELQLLKVQEIVAQVKSTAIR